MMMMMMMLSSSSRRRVHAFVLFLLLLSSVVVVQAQRWEDRTAERGSEFNWSGSQDVTAVTGEARTSNDNNDDDDARTKAEEETVCAAAVSNASSSVSTGSCAASTRQSTKENEEEHDDDEEEDEEDEYDDEEDDDHELTEEQIQEAIKEWKEKYGHIDLNHDDDVEDEDDMLDLEATEIVDAEDWGQDMGVPQHVYGNPLTQQRLEQARRYWTALLAQPEKYTGQHDDWKQVCVNREPECAFWATQGECQANEAYMKSHCAPVCESCDYAQAFFAKVPGVTPSEQPEVKEEVGYVGSDIGVPQRVQGNETIRARLLQAQQYLHERVQKEDKYELVRKICVNKHELCAVWAVHGECTANPNFMETNCAPVCETCEQMHIVTRCPVDLSVGDALYPGDLNRLFERLIQDPAMQQYQPKALSRPYYAENDTPLTADYQLGMWLVVLDNLATPEEALRMRELAELEGYNRSADVGAIREDGTYSDIVNDGRTSENAWCEKQCYNDTVARRIMDRMEHITGIPEHKAEHLQLLRYQVGQKYQTHNDYIPHQIDRPPGVRILTFFLYLSDVEEGGETDFPRLGLRVTPKTGRAVLWPSVFDHDPNQNDVRSDHQALPVIKGTKYGANAWYHQRDVKLHNGNCL